MSAPRILVMGASGSIGRQVIAPLLERGFEVHAVSQRPVIIPGVNYDASSESAAAPLLNWAST
jgi:nucleoside-diphosphate-sugar epimerase